MGGWVAQAEGFVFGVGLAAEPGLLLILNLTVVSLGGYQTHQRQIQNPSCSYWPDTVLSKLIVCRSACLICPASGLGPAICL